MKKWVECVPNFSEGRNPVIIEAISDAIRGVRGARLLHIDSGADANRTVITFAASPKNALDAGFRAIAAAAESIDMSRQHGAHRRIGATDVFPFVPLRNTTFEECIELAKQLAERVSIELGIPVYLYGKAATRPERVRIPSIRRGGYEALKRNIGLPKYKPDFGDASFPEKHGATIIGVRDFLLAYNVNLDTTDVEAAKTIARAVRESGVSQRDPAGRVERDEHGKIKRIPGRLVACQADGWLMPSYECAQVTMNLLDYRRTGLHAAYEAVKSEAKALGIAVNGSELIGLAPKAAILDAGIHYSKDVPVENETALIATAIEYLGLSSVREFKPEQKIIEMVLG